MQYLRVDPLSSVLALEESPPDVDTIKTRELFLDVAEALWESQSIIGSLMKDFSIPVSETDRNGGEYYAESCQLPCCEIAFSPSSGASAHTVYELWSSVLARRAYLYLFMRRLCYHYSSLRTDFPQDESSVLQMIDRHSHEFIGFESLYLQQTDTTPSNLGGNPYTHRMKEFLDKIEHTLLDCIIGGWSMCHRILSHQNGHCDRVVMWHDQQPPIVRILNSLIVGYYNRIISLIGAHVDQKNFELLPGNQSKLDLITFVILNNDSFSEFVKVVLNTLGLHVEPLPKLSLALNVEGLLGRYASAMMSELDLYMSRVLASSRCDSECKLTVGDGSAVSFEPPSWDVDIVKDRVIIGPVPELVHTIALTFLHLAKAPRAELAVESRKQAFNMNFIIARSVLHAHIRLMEKYEKVLSEVDEMLTFLLDRKTAVHIENALNDMISFICSVANDCARVSAEYLPQIMSEMHYLLDAGRHAKDSANVDAAVARGFLDSLNALADQVKCGMIYLSWTAVELLTKIIYMDLEEEYVVKFDDLWNPSTTRESALETIMRTVADYCSDFMISFTDDNYHLLLLSCSHKLVQR